MKSRAFAVVAVVFLASSGIPWASAGAQEGDVDPGHQALIDNKCNMCHPIEAAGIERTSKSDKMKGADLSTVGDEHDAAWIVQYVKKEVEVEGEPHKRSYKGTDEDLEAIAAWLATLKTPAAE